MKLIIKALPILLLNTTIWVMLYYYIKSIGSSGLDTKQKKRLRLGLGIFVIASAAGLMFQEEFILYMQESTLIQEAMYQVYFLAYSLFFGLFTALGLFLFMSVGFSKMVEKE